MATFNIGLSSPANQQYRCLFGRVSFPVQLTLLHNFVTTVQVQDIW